MSETNLSDQDIRWKQRLSNLQRAFDQLSSAIAIARNRELSELEKQGLIQAFEFTHELSWNVMKDYFVYQGNTSITGSRDASREAFQVGLITKGEVWMEMIKSRNQTTHTYNQEVAREIIRKIKEEYFDEFEKFLLKMNELSKND